MKGTFWWVGATVFALIAGFLAYRVVLPGLQGDDGLLQGNTTEVVVAVQDIPLRRSITGAELTLQALPSDSIPEGALTSLEDAVGMMSSVDVYSGKPLLGQNLVTPDEITRRLALSIPETMTVIPIPIDSHLIRAGLIRPQDFIDVASTFEIEIQGTNGSSAVPETVALLRNIEVHALILPVQDIAQGGGDENEDGTDGVFESLASGDQTIIVALDRNDALTLQHVIDVGGKLGVMLHAPGDVASADTVPVDALYLAERFNIPLVRGEPFELTEEYFLANMEEFVFTGEGIPKPDISDLSN